MSFTASRRLCGGETCHCPHRSGRLGGDRDPRRRNDPGRRRVLSRGGRRFASQRFPKATTSDPDMPCPGLTARATVSTHWPSTRTSSSGVAPTKHPRAVTAHATRKGRRPQLLAEPVRPAVRDDPYARQQSDVVERARRVRRAQRDCVRTPPAGTSYMTFWVACPRGSTRSHDSRRQFIARRRIGGVAAWAIGDYRRGALAITGREPSGSIR